MSPFEFYIFLKPMPKRNTNSTYLTFRIPGARLLDYLINDY